MTNFAYGMIIADGGINGSLNVYSEELFLKLKSYVRRREN